MAALTPENNTPTRPEAYLEAAAVAVRDNQLCSSEYSLDSSALERKVNFICEQLTQAWQGFVEQNHQDMLATSLPSNAALYNLACVQSLCCELYLKLYIEQDEGLDRAVCAGIIDRHGNETVAERFVPVSIPPFVQGAPMSVKSMIDGRLDVGQKCLQIAVSAGYGRGEDTGPLAIEHMRRNDADLLAIRAVKGFDWLG